MILDADIVQNYSFCFSKKDGIVMATRKNKVKKHVKLPNGFGRITCIKDKSLRNPWRAMVTIGRDEEGKPRGKILGYYPSWEDAYYALEEYHRNPYELDVKTVTVQDLFEKWSESYFNELSVDSSVRTITSAWQYVPPHFRRLNAASLKPQAIKDFILMDAYKQMNDGTHKKPSDNMRSRLKSIFNLMYDYAVLSDLVPVNPAKQFSLNGIGKKIEKHRNDKVPITKEHEQILWDDLEFGYTKMVLINIYTGWRPQELILLKKEDVDLKNWTMKGGMKTDAGMERLVPIHPKIRPLVLYYYNKSPGDLLFYNYDASWSKKKKQKPIKMTYDQYRGRFKKIQERHGWNCYSPSCPRHTFSTNAKEHHMDSLARKLIMGHEIYDVTDKHYTHIDLISFLHEEVMKI